jgi:23S rRNA pseudouridine2605 synthase
MTAIRLTRFLARAGASSRRGAAELVAAGRVLINGHPPLGPGDPVDPLADVVTLDGRVLRLAETMHLALHKPTGYVTSRSATGRFPPVFDLLKGAPRALAVVGRLDVMTEGLLLFTTDGELASRLMHPKWVVPRSYVVEVSGTVGSDAREALDHGLVLTGETRPVRPLSWRFTPLPRGGRLELALGEGRSRVVRRLCRALRLQVRRLMRQAYGPIALGDLPSGAVRALTPREVAALYRAVRLAPPEPQP